MVTAPTYIPTNSIINLCGSAGKESSCNAGDLGSIQVWSLREGNGYPFQYSGLENSMDLLVHGVAKSQTPLSSFQYPGNTFQCLPELQEGRGWSYLSDWSHVDCASYSQPGLFWVIVGSLLSWRACVCVGVSRLVLSDSLWPVDSSPPGSSIHGIFQARILQWVAISFLTWAITYSSRRTHSCLN